jgi:CheY-like chemotaxis protein
VVDDEEQICKMIQLMLSRLNYTVTSFLNPVEALSAFKEEPDRFDLVITDMTMPEMTGTELAGSILKQRADIPIILCTGFSDLTDHNHSQSIGIRGYLTKPVTKKGLTEKIRELLDGTG